MVSSVYSPAESIQGKKWSGGSMRLRCFKAPEFQTLRTFVRISSRVCEVVAKSSASRSQLYQSPSLSVKTGSALSSYTFEPFGSPDGRT